jgi:hypothetical protein
VPMTKSKYFLAGVLALAPLGTQAQSTGDDVRFPISPGCLSKESHCRLPTGVGCLSKEGYLAFRNAVKEAHDHGSWTERYALTKSVKGWGCVRPQDISLLPLGSVVEEDGPVALLKFGLKEYWFDKKNTTTDSAGIRKYVETFLSAEKKRELKEVIDALVPGDTK